MLVENENKSVRINANELDKALSKSSRDIARIDMKKVIELTKKVVP